MYTGERYSSVHRVQEWGGLCVPGVLVTLSVLGTHLLGNPCAALGVEKHLHMHK
jgi:hypothetical protein